MTQTQYSTAHENMSIEVRKFTNNKYLKSIIPSQVIETFEVLLDFIAVSKLAIFKDGKILELSIFNIRRWWKFVKLSHQFIKKIIEIWK